MFDLLKSGDFFLSSPRFLRNLGNFLKQGPQIYFSSRTLLVLILSFSLAEHLLWSLAPESMGWELATAIFCKVWVWAWIAWETNKNDQEMCSFCHCGTSPLTLSSLWPRRMLQWCLQRLHVGRLRSPRPLRWLPVLRYPCSLISRINLLLMWVLRSKYN